MNARSLVIAKEIESRMKTIWPADQFSDTSVDVLRFAIGAGINLAIDAYKVSLYLEIDDHAIKAYLRNHVRGYK